MTVRPLIAAAVALTLTATTHPSPPQPVLWAWERPEDLRFAGPDVTIAILAGTIRLAGNTVQVQPRLQPAQVMPTQLIIGVVHLEVDRTHHPPWTASQRAETATQVLRLLHNPRFTAAQIDFEVTASDRPMLLDLLADIRAGLPPGQTLSMTALASWCDTETWINAAPVDEIVPMLFRMGQTGEPIRQRLAHGGDFRQPRCRTAIGVAMDTPPEALPPGRRIWMFNPRPWTRTDFTVLRDRLRT
jgi:hypothetical protein